jgi:hypothetical protein
MEKWEQTEKRPFSVADLRSGVECFPRFRKKTATFKD